MTKMDWCSSDAFGYRGLTNLDAISGFAVTVPILTAKGEHQLQLQEMLLEMAANAILHQRDL
jgi:hypothetical protein